MRHYVAVGHKRLAGYTHVDIAATDGIDVVHDLNQLPWTWDDDSVSIITAEDVVEHRTLILPPFAKRRGE